MGSFKNEILQALKKSNSTNEILDKISNYQNVLMKNYNNQILSKEMKNKILDIHTELQNLGKLIYKQGLLKQHNIINEEDNEDLEGVVLKGGISNVRYVWHSEQGEHTCDECAELDGQEFDMFDDIPEKPHPNCQCTIEMIEDNSEEEEPCDCWEKIDELVEETNSWQDEIENDIYEIDSIKEENLELLNEIKTFKQKIENAQSELEDIEPCSKNCVACVTGMAINITDDQNLEDIMTNITNLTDESKEVYQIFLEHKHEMEETRDGMDKYYHAKANCTAAELGEIQTLWAGLYSILKEVKDFIYKVFKYNMDFKEVAKDCLQDLKADWYGIQKAKEHGYCSDKVKNVYEDVFNKKD